MLLCPDSKSPRVWRNAKGVRHIFFELRNKRLGHEDHVAWPQVEVFADVLPMQNVIEFQFANFGPVRRYSTVKENLRLRRGREPAGERYGLRYRDVASQIVLARLSHLAQHGKERLLEID